MNRLLGILAVALGVVLGITVQGILSNSFGIGSYLVLVIAGSILAFLAYFTYWVPKNSERSKKIREGLIRLAGQKTIPNFEEFVKAVVTKL